MSLIGNIDNIPLFTTIREAELWGQQYGLTGYHTHQYQGMTGYMGGSNHNNAITGNINATIPTTQQPQQPTPLPQTTMGSSVGGSGGSSGGGGGGY